MLKTALVLAFSLLITSPALADYQPPDVGGPGQTKGAGTRNEPENPLMQSADLTRPARGSSNNGTGR